VVLGTVHVQFGQLPKGRGLIPPLSCPALPQL
jgi:hypothetical protein